MARALWAVIAASFVLAGAACTEPQSGVISSRWCPHDATLDTLDDFEDGDGALCNGWGKWILTAGAGITNTTPVAADGTLLGAQPTAEGPTALAAGDATSTRALHVTAGGFTAGTGADPNYWAVLRATFVPPGPFAVASYTGIRFRAISAVPVRLRVNVATDMTRDQAAGDAFGRTVAVDASGAQTTVMFATTTQEGYGPAIPQDLTNAVLLSFDFKLASQFVDDLRDTNPDSFDLWLDDVQLLR